jgi:hypothetical protein
VTRKRLPIGSSLDSAATLDANSCTSCVNERFLTPNIKRVVASTANACQQQGTSHIFKDFLTWRQKTLANA